MGKKSFDENNELYSAIVQLKTEQECKSFFTDLCTINELLSMEQRFKVAQLLDEGYIYNDIVEKTGASSATISRVSRALNYGEDGYRTVLDRLKSDINE